MFETQAGTKIIKDSERESCLNQPMLIPVTTSAAVGAEQAHTRPLGGTHPHTPTPKVCHHFLLHQSFML